MPELRKKAARMQLRSPVFILGCHKSGTSLVRSLLDGHPEIDFTYPNELHYFRVAGCEMRYPLGRRFPAPADFSALAANALAMIGPAAKGDRAFAPFGPHPRLEEFQPDTFLRTMGADPPPMNVRDRLMRYLEASAAALGFDLGLRKHPLRIVEKSVSNLEFAATLKQLFPDCQFVHVLRNPYANLVAIRSAKRSPGSIGALRAFVRAIRLSFDEALRNRQAIAGFHVLRYEDLVRDPEATARDICRRLGLGYSASMLVPTVLGRSWGGNSSSREDFGSAVSQRPLHEWRNTVAGIEIELVNRHLSDVMTVVGYDALRPRRHWLIPDAQESLSAFLSNRAYLRFGRERAR